MPITHLFFDIGGVLGTNGWDGHERAAAVTRFGLDAEDFDRRHREVVGTWEMGGMTVDEYLEHTVFDDPRDFTPAEFIAFMKAQSEPNQAAIELARTLGASGRYRMMALNNESEMLNLHRVRSFGLMSIFQAFFTSCWTGVMKPSHRAYALAIAMSQADPASSIFIDDRVNNLVPARALGMHVIHFTGVPELRHELDACGVTY
ncbi:MAG: HAD family hydrolase [Gemmatimonadaceae bacterium]